MSVELGLSIGCTLIGLIIGGFLGFYFTRRKFEKELKENPPINEKMIRAMFLQSISQHNSREVNRMRFPHYM